MYRFALIAAASSLFASACTLNEDNFAEEFAEATCKYYVDCAQEFDDVDDCYDDDRFDDVDDVCPDYDASAASDCIEAMEDIADNCSSPTFTIPVVCNSVCNDTEAMNEG